MSIETSKYNKESELRTARNPSGYERMQEHLECLALRKLIGCAHTHILERKGRCATQGSTGTKGAAFELEAAGIARVTPCHALDHGFGNFSTVLAKPGIRVAAPDHGDGHIHPESRGADHFAQCVGECRAWVRSSRR